MQKLVPYGLIAVLVLLGVLISQNFSPIETVKSVLSEEMKTVDQEQNKSNEDDSDADADPLTLRVDTDGNVTGTLRFWGKVEDPGRFDPSIFGAAMNRLQEAVVEPPAQQRALPQQGWQPRQSQPSSQPRVIPKAEPKPRQPPTQPQSFQASPTQRVMTYHHYISPYVPARR